VKRAGIWGRGGRLSLFREVVWVYRERVGKWVFGVRELLGGEPGSAKWLRLAAFAGS